MSPLLRSLNPRRWSRMMWLAAVCVGSVLAITHRRITARRVAVAQARLHALRAIQLPIVEDALSPLPHSLQVRISPHRIELDPEPLLATLPPAHRDRWVAAVGLRTDWFATGASVPLAEGALVGPESERAVGRLRAALDAAISTTMPWDEGANGNRSVRLLEDPQVLYVVDQDTPLATVLAVLVPTERAHVRFAVQRAGAVGTLPLDYDVPEHDPDGDVRASVTLTPTNLAVRNAGFQCWRYEDGKQRAPFWAHAQRTAVDRGYAWLDAALDDGCPRLDRAWRLRRGWRYMPPCPHDPCSGNAIVFETTPEVTYADAIRALLVAATIEKRLDADPMGSLRRVTRFHWRTLDSVELQEALLDPSVTGWVHDDQRAPLPQRR